MEEGIESEKKKSCDMDSELQREEQTASELLCRLEEIRVSNSSMEQEVHANYIIQGYSQHKWLFEDHYRRTHF